MCWHVIKSTNEHLIFFSEKLMRTNLFLFIFPINHYFKLLYPNVRIHTSICLLRLLNRLREQGNRINSILLPCSRNLSVAWPVFENMNTTWVVKNYCRNFNLVRRTKNIFEVKTNLDLIFISDCPKLQKVKIKRRLPVAFRGYEFKHNLIQLSFSMTVLSKDYRYVSSDDLNDSSSLIILLYHTWHWNEFSTRLTLTCHSQYLFTNNFRLLFYNLRIEKWNSLRKYLQ